MLNRKVIDALEACKEILIKELREEVKKSPQQKVEINFPIPSITVAYDVIFNGYLLTLLEETPDGLMVNYRDFDDSYEKPNEYRDEISNFTIDEISKMIDEL